MIACSGTVGCVAILGLCTWTVGFTNDNTLCKHHDNWITNLCVHMMIIEPNKYLDFVQVYIDCVQIMAWF